MIKDSRLMLIFLLKTAGFCLRLLFSYSLVVLIVLLRVTCYDKYSFFTGSLRETADRTWLCLSILSSSRQYTDLENKMTENSKNEVIRLVHDTRNIILNKEYVHHITEKGAADYVTAADQGVQNFLEKELPALTPDVILFAEEKENEAMDPEKSYWILDPVDGTTNLIHDYQMSAVSLALYEDGDISFGIVYNPFTEDTFLAEAGKGALYNGTSISVSGCGSLKDALISFGSCPYQKELAVQLFPVFQRVFEKTADFRRTGSAALDLCYVAMGRQDAYFEYTLKPWDYAAGQLILKEAGGICTDFAGKPLPILKNSSVFGCTPGIHQALLEELKVLV